VRLATFFPTYGHNSSPSEAGSVSRHLAASITSSCHTITWPSLVRPPMGQLCGRDGEQWDLDVQSNSREVTPSLRPIAKAGSVL
jgi:hypothetical protein